MSNKIPLEVKTAELEEFLTAEDVSEKLKIKLSTIYYWVQVRAIPFFKVGRHVRFRASDLDRWLERQRKGKVRIGR